MSIFDSYNNLPKDYKPNNMFRCHSPKPIEIMTGETAIHDFEVPFDVDKSCQMVEVIYKLGLKPIIIKNNLLYLEVLPSRHGSIVRCTLKPSETLLFKNTTLDTHVQLKFYMVDKSITYSEVYKVKVEYSLDDTGREEVALRSQIAGTEDDKIGLTAIGGYGYTED